MLNLNKYTPLFMKRFLPILMRASYTRIHIDRNLYMWVFLKLRGQKSTLFGTSTKSSTFLRQTLLIKCRQPQNTSSKIYLSMYTFVKEYLQPFWGLFTVFSYQNNESQSTWPFSREIYRGEVMNSTERPGKERMRRSSIPMLLPYEVTDPQGCQEAQLKLYVFFITTKCDILVLLHCMNIKAVSIKTQKKYFSILINYNGSS